MALNTNYITEKGKLSSAGAWIWLVVISKTGYPTLRYTSDGTYTTWPTIDGNGYTARSIAMDDAEASLQGKFPEYKLSIGEVDLTSTLRTSLVTAGGYVGGEIQLMIVHSAHLTLTTPAIDEHATILNCEVTAQAVTFTLGIPNLLTRRFPRDRYVPYFCRHKFAGAMCKYVPPVTCTLTSSNVLFSTGAVATNTIQVTDGGLLTDVFKKAHAPGTLICPDNMVVNGDFENGTVDITGWLDYGADNWALWSEPDDAVRQWKDNVHKYSSHSYYHFASTTNAGIYQSIEVNTNLTYTLSCWIYTLPLQSDISVRVMMESAGNYYSVYGVSGGVWRRFTRSVSPAQTPLNLFVGGKGIAYFDGICLIEGDQAGEFDKYELTKDMIFTVTGSNSNDGYFIANSDYPIDDKYVRVRTEDDGGRAMVEEAIGADVTIQLGYDACDHTIEACKLRNNMLNYGGSPGVKGGIYG